MDEKFIINGGRQLEGEIEVRGAKNAAFPILAATLLTKKECVVENMPLIEDVFERSRTPLNLRSIIDATKLIWYYFLVN